MFLNQARITYLFLVRRTCLVCSLCLSYGKSSVAKWGATNKILLVWDKTFLMSFITFFKRALFFQVHFFLNYMLEKQKTKQKFTLLHGLPGQCRAAKANRALNHATFLEVMRHLVLVRHYWPIACLLCLAATFSSFSQSTSATQRITASVSPLS